jgi:4-amino-4-deoxy-L-arabinose transferase-like glycosyltransferase
MPRNKPLQVRPKLVGPGRSFTDRRWPVMLVGLFLTALSWRLAYLGRLLATPLAGTLRADERVYWDWATFLVDHGLRGTNPFFLGPLYPYVLALVRLVVGSQVANVLTVQAVWGAAAVILLTDAARRLTRPSIAIGLGVVLALYEMAVFFDGLILMESLLFFLEALLIWLWCRSPKTPVRIHGLAVIAIVTGLIAQCRATGILLLIPGLMLAAQRGEPERARWRLRVVVTASVFFLTMIPAALWNWSVSREFIPFTYNLGLNLYAGNNPDADGGYIDVTGASRLGAVEASRPDGGGEIDGRGYLKKVRGLNLTPGQSSSYWASEAMVFLRENPGRAAALAGTKLLLAFNREETPQIENVNLFRSLAGPLGLPVAGTFLLLGLLGIVGLVHAGGWGPPGRAIQSYVVLLTLGILPFFVTDRYRVHLVPALALLAALAVETLVQRLRARPRRGMQSLAVSAVVAMTVVMLPVSGSDRGYDAWLGARGLAIRWLEQGRPDLAVREFERAMRLERTQGLDRDPDPWLAQQRAELYFNYGVALRQTRNESEALDWLRAAAVADPSNPRYVRTLGDAYVLHGRIREGDSLLLRVRSMVGGEGEALLSDGWRAARAGRLDVAEESFQQAVSGDARLYGAWGALIRVQVQRGEPMRAKETLARAAKTGMPVHMIKAHEALVEATLGNSAAAWRALEQVPQSAAEGDPTLSRLVSRTREMLEHRR